MANLFDVLRAESLLAICEECGDGNPTHPIDEDGLCVRHGDWSVSAARSKVEQAEEATMVKVSFNGKIIRKG